MAGVRSRTSSSTQGLCLVALIVLICSPHVMAGVVSIKNIDLATLASPTGFKLLGSTQYGRLGYCVNSAGDVNGDGFNDILIGEIGGGVGYSFTGSNGIKYYDNYVGVVYVVFGRANGTLFADMNLNNMVTGPSVGYRINGRTELSLGGQLGFSVSKAGDFNGDGVGDILVGAITDPTSNPYVSDGGAAYVLFGRKNSTFAADINLQTMVTGRFTGFRIHGSSRGEYIGSSVAAAGDINGDGVDDIIIGSSIYALGQGANFILFGRRVYTNGAAFTNINLGTFAFTAATGFRISGFSAIGSVSIRTGWGTSAAGDVNNDGIGDIILCGQGSNFAHVIYGRNTSGSINQFSNIALLDWVTSNTTGFRLVGTGISTVSSAGDVNGDGISDLIIGTARYSYPLAAYVVFGRNVAAKGAFADILLETEYYAGFKVVGGPVYGADSGGDTSATFVRSAGDVNGDSISDLIIGFQYGVRAKTKNVGISYVLFGKNTTLAGIDFADINVTNFRADIYTGYCIYGAHGGALSGSSVSGAGDINNDGFGDIIIGSYKDKGTATVNGLEYGAAYVIYGGNYIPMPTAAPTFQPTRGPTRTPSFRPTNTPISKPTTRPTVNPTVNPSIVPSPQPSSHPSTRPSSQPTTVPTTLPTTQPTTQPTSFPSAQPTDVPSSQPTIIPTAQPSIQPSSHPSTQPTTQPTLVPLSQPSSQPTVQPSAQPTTIPSQYPTTQPSCVPTTQPTTQPSMQPVQRPTAVPTILPLPTSQPTALPSVQPTTQPSSQPTCQPTNQPSTHPTAQPSSQPSAYPTYRPTATNNWYTLFDNTTLHRLSAGTNTVWACGRNDRATCVVLDASTGSVYAHYQLGWDAISFVTYVPAMSTVYIGGSSAGPAVHSVIGTCLVDTTSTLMTCAVRSYANIEFMHGAHSSFSNRVLYVGKTFMYAIAMLTDPDVGISKCYSYRAANMKFMELLYTSSTPRFVGNMVVGTAVSVSNIISVVAGWISLDTGSFSAMYLTPSTGLYLMSDNLVTGMVVEPSGPDMFIVGGMELSLGSAGISAYVICANALYRTVRYTVQFVTSMGSRRSLRATSAVHSVCRGVIRSDTDLFVIVDYTVERANYSVAVLRVAIDSGEIIDQATISAHSANIMCTDIVMSNKDLLHVACTVHYPESKPHSVVLTTTKKLLFTRIPQGFATSTNTTFRSEPMALKATHLPIVKQSVTEITVNAAFVADNKAPTYRPTTRPTLQPTPLPSLTPSSQPTSTPTATPTESPQPTSQPSTSGPTNTYKPIATPTAKPTLAPTISHTVPPTTTPTTSPTLHPTIIPTRSPSTHPTASATSTPTTSPSVKKTTHPSTVRTVRPTRAAPTVQPSAAGSALQNANVRASSADENSIMYIVVATFGGAVCFVFCGRFLWKVYGSYKKGSEKRMRRAAYNDAYSGLRPRWYSIFSASGAAMKIHGTRSKDSALLVSPGGEVTELPSSGAWDNQRGTHGSRDSEDSLYDEILRDGSEYSYCESLSD